MLSFDHITMYLVGLSVRSIIARHRSRRTMGHAQGCIRFYYSASFWALRIKLTALILYHDYTAKMMRRPARSQPFAFLRQGSLLKLYTAQEPRSNLLPTANCSLSHPFEPRFVWVMSTIWQIAFNFCEKFRWKFSLMN